MDQVNESSTSYLAVSFFDKTGAPEVPVSATYSIYNVTAGVSILPPTAVSSLASVTTITITAAQNALVSHAIPYELRRVVVTSVYGTDQLVSSYLYEVLNVTYGDY